MSSLSPQPKLTLYRGWDSPGKYVWSPFVTKLEFRLRTSHTPYTNAAGSTFSGPKGKIPYMAVDETANPPELLADSSLIIKALRERGLIKDVNESLSGRDRGLDLAVRALMEDKLCFFHTHERWIQNYYVMRDYALSAVPYPLRVVVGMLAFRGNVRKLHDQGTGRFSDAEIRGFIEEIWTGVDGLLEDSRRMNLGRPEGECYWVLGGEEPTEADATVYGFVASVLVSKAGPESGRLLRERFPRVVSWAERVHGAWFPDYEIWE
ncbi:hypothetical protein K505DRAFT_329772 [Melanomma pulvis-pyrius CBS 109.77]|uniref:Thioredoxin-like fold domain-containing protein n=1 Tax=Melanomma pulvis-pyrius CBS 109.77 TaxID=1314802 RepID=A0A6A6WTQ4_9PLEO|nr:hypothetical protein K505DRAFT_329772 [Melanomma pulvis-pyrius CBS 109.77]